MTGKVLVQCLAIPCNSEGAESVKGRISPKKKMKYGKIANRMLDFRLLELGREESGICILFKVIN